MFTKLSTDSTLRQALSGKRIIEYPILIVGLQPHIDKLNLMIRDLSRPNSNIAVPGVVETSKENSKKRMSVNELASDTKKIRFEKCVDSNEDLSEKATHSDIAVSNDNVDIYVEQSEEDIVCEESFHEELAEIEKADIETLQGLVQEFDHTPNI